MKTNTEANPTTMAGGAEYVLSVALDWGDKKHAWALRVAGSPKVEQGEVDASPEAMEVWASALGQRSGGAPVALVLEQPRGAVVAMLGKYAHLVLYPVPASMSAHYRQGFRPSGAKSDASDAVLLLDLVEKHRDHLRVLKPDSDQTRLLQLLTEQRRRIVDERTGYANQLQDGLKQVFPQMVRWFEDVKMPLVRAVLQRWPSLEELKKAKPETLRKFFHQHSCRSESLIEERIREISEAVPATRDVALLEAMGMRIKHWLRIIAEQSEAIKELEQKIETVARQHPDYDIFGSLPGAGEALIPRLIAAWGTDRDRYQNAQQMLCYSGIAPVVSASGNRSWVHWRWACPKFLRQTFHEFAQHSMAQSEWALAYYEHQRERGKQHHAAVRALAYKWIRIMFRCWKQRKLYQESQYQDVLRKRLTPKVQEQPADLKILWGSCGSAHRIKKLSGISA